MIMSIVILCINALLPYAMAVARFEPASITDVSLVIRMIKGGNVSSFDMSIQIFDLDRLIEYRRTQLKGSTRDQLFSFDGLTPGTWFAFRIHYQLHYENSHDQRREDLKTKQEIIVRTKDSQYEDPTLINDSIAYIDDLFFTKNDIYIGVGTIFKDIKKVITVIVPELRCSKGVLKPLAQQVIKHASFHFDLTQLGDSDKVCTEICVFPFLRVAIQNRTSETFRGKEWCGSIAEVRRLVSINETRPSNVIFVILGTVGLFFVRSLLS